MTSYHKLPKTVQEQLELLKAKGLHISNQQYAYQILSVVNYTRLSSYFSPFFIPKTTNFIHCTKFEDIISLYNFDRRLRFVTLEALEQIEVAVRTVISNLMSIRYSNPFWYKDSTLFINLHEHAEFIKLCVQHAGRKKFLNSTNAFKNNHIELYKFYQKYSDTLPPYWMLSETLPMGCWSKLFANLKEKQAKRQIADAFQFIWTDFETWLKAITLYRNTIAHHQRFWNESYAALNLPNLNKYLINCGTTDKIYLNYLVIFRLLKSITKKLRWKNQLVNILKQCPLNIHDTMNFPVGWEKLDFWN